MNDQWMEPDTTEATEFIDKVPAPEKAEGYVMMIKSMPKFKLASTGVPYLEWFFVHTGENTKYSAVFERTMMAGKGAFRHFGILNALGYTNEQIKASFKYRALAPLTDENKKEGVACELSIGGEKITPMGRTVLAVLKIETGNDGIDRSAIKSVKKVA